MRKCFLETTRRLIKLLRGDGERRHEAYGVRFNGFEQHAGRIRMRQHTAREGPVELHRRQEALAAHRSHLGLTVVSGTFYCDGMPQEMARRNLHRCVREMMPALAPAEARAP